MQTPTLDIEKSYWAKGITHVCGIDEAGYGAWAGPLFAAAVIVKPDSALKHVRDSKLLSPKKREELFDVVITEVLAYAIEYVSAEKIDRLGVAAARKQLFVTLIERVAEAEGVVLIDGNHLSKFPYPHRGIIDGDATVMTIAAASILAKVSRDRAMRELDTKFPFYGFAAHKGYGTKQHRDALITHGPATCHRFSYAPIKAFEKTRPAEYTTSI